MIRVDGVTKNFVLRKDNSLKDRLLSFRAARQHRESFTALRNIHLEFRAGHTVALIGHNGSGKSTLLKVIGNILDPSEGSVARRGRIAALLELGAGFHPDLSGRDNVFLNASLLGMSRTQTEAVFDRIVEFAELEEFIDTQVKFYSSGMYVRLAFAVAVHTDPDILLVDEVLAVGDEAFQRKCMDVIRRFQAEGRTILLVTHNLAQVVELADSAVLLHHGDLIFNGEPREAVALFRDLLEENRLEHMISEPARDSDEESKISVKTTCTVEGDSSLSTVQLGDTLHVDIEVSGRVTDEDWMLSIQIENTMGLAVFGAANDLIQMPLTPIAGRSGFRFSIADTRFGEGRYFVNVSIMSGDGAHIYDAIQSASFTAKAPSTSRGVISMQYTLAQHK